MDNSFSVRSYYIRHIRLAHRIMTDGDGVHRNRPMADNSWFIFPMLAIRENQGEAECLSKIKTHRIP